MIILTTIITTIITVLHDNNNNTDDNNNDNDKPDDNKKLKAWRSPVAGSEPPHAILNTQFIIHTYQLNYVNSLTNYLDYN